MVINLAPYDNHTINMAVTEVGAAILVFGADMLSPLLSLQKGYHKCNKWLSYQYHFQYLHEVGRLSFTGVKLALFYGS